MPIKVYRPKQLIFAGQVQAPIDQFYCLPTLVFLGGGYPRVGIFGYDRLLRHIAAKGVQVLVPLYVPSPAEETAEQKEAIGVLRHGYHSENAAFLIQQGLRDFLTQKENAFCRAKTSWVLYGHSLGARVALALSRTSPAGINWQGMLLEGFAGHKIIDDTYDPFQDGRSLALDGPLTLVFQENDAAFGEATINLYRAFAVNKSAQRETPLAVPAKQLIAILGPRADHFTPFSDDPPTHRGLKAYVWDQLARSLHGYSPTLQLDSVDRVDTFTLLPALALAASDFDSSLSCSPLSPMGIDEPLPRPHADCLLRHLAAEAKKILYGTAESLNPWTVPNRVLIDRQGF